MADTQDSRPSVDGNPPTDLPPSQSPPVEDNGESPRPSIHPFGIRCIPFNLTIISIILIEISSELLTFDL